jgi:molybdopterin-synthase adenylyltransferase
VNALTNDEIERYGRQIIVPGVGGAGQQRLKDAKVLVIGAGGLGSPSLLYLAAAGVGRIGVVDADSVDVTNLQRQVAHATADIGRNKAESAAETMSAINPLIDVDVHPVRIAPENALDLIGDYDLVLDGTDNFPTRYLINDACVMLQRPLVTAAILRYSGQIMVVQPGSTACYRCVFPEPPPAGSVPSCSQAGILGPVAGVMGSLQALEAIKVLIGADETIAGRFIAIDFRTLENQVMELCRNEQCAVCGDKPSITELHQTTESCSVRWSE